MVLQRQKIVNDENGNRLETPIQLNDLRVELTPDLLAKDVASFRMFLATQVQTQIIEGN